MMNSTTGRTSGRTATQGDATGECGECGECEWRRKIPVWHGQLLPTLLAPKASLRSSPPEWESVDRAGDRGETGARATASHASYIMGRPGRVAVAAGWRRQEAQGKR